MEKLVLRILGSRRAGEVPIGVPSQISWDRLKDTSATVGQGVTPSQRLAFSLRRDLTSAGIAKVEKVLARRDEGRVIGHEGRDWNGLSRHSVC